MSKVRRYSFDEDDATAYGIEAALFIHHLRYWIDKNRSNEKHFHDGRWWTFQSASGFTKIFPFWSDDQIHRLIKKLSALGILATAHYGTGRGNRALWYAFKDEATFLPEASEPSDETPRNRGMDSEGDSAEPRKYFRESAVPNRESAESLHAYTDTYQDKEPKTSGLNKPKPKNQPWQGSKPPDRPANWRPPAIAASPTQDEIKAQAKNVAELKKQLAKVK